MENNSKEELILKMKEEFDILCNVAKDILESVNWDYKRAQKCAQILLEPKKIELGNLPTSFIEKYKDALDRKRWFLVNIYKEKQENDPINNQKLDSRFVHVTVSGDSEECEHIKKEYDISEFPCYIIIDPPTNKLEKKEKFEDEKSLYSSLNSFLEVNQQYGLPIEDLIVREASEEGELVTIKLRASNGKYDEINIHEGETVEILYQKVGNIIGKPIGYFMICSASTGKMITQMDKTIKEEGLKESVINAF